MGGIVITQNPGTEVQLSIYLGLIVLSILHAKKHTVHGNGREEAKNLRYLDLIILTVLFPFKILSFSIIIS